MFDSQKDPRVKWEFLKYKIFRFSKNYANELAEKRKEKWKSLENKVIMLEKHLVETEFKSELKFWSMNLPKLIWKRSMIMLQVVQFLGQKFDGMKKKKRTQATFCH